MGMKGENYRRIEDASMEKECLNKIKEKKIQYFSLNSKRKKSFWKHKEYSRETQYSNK